MRTGWLMVMGLVRVWSSGATVRAQVPAGPGAETGADVSTELEVADQLDGIASLLAAGDTDEALTVARFVPGPDTTRALVGALGSIPPRRHALVIGALSDLGDAAARPAVLEAATHDAVQVRLAAIRALKRYIAREVFHIITKRHREINQTRIAA